MKIELKLKFNSYEDLASWFDATCTKCCLCNNGRKVSCKECRANKIWKRTMKDLGKDLDDYEEDD